MCGGGADGACQGGGGGNGLALVGAWAAANSEWEDPVAVAGPCLFSAPPSGRRDAILWCDGYQSLGSFVKGTIGGRSPQPGLSLWQRRFHHVSDSAFSQP